MECSIRLYGIGRMEVHLCQSFEMVLDAILNFGDYEDYTITHIHGENLNSMFLHWYRQCGHLIFEEFAISKANQL